MTKKEKDLLIQDLCGRLPYGVKIELRNSRKYHHENISKGNRNTVDKLKGFTGKYFTIYHDNPLDWDWSDSDVEVEDIKPYLFPMSNMTEEQKKECNFADDLDSDILDAALCTNHYNRTGIPTVIYNLVDWCNKNHFDYRGLIPMGLAKDATGLGIY